MSGLQPSPEHSQDKQEEQCHNNHGNISFKYDDIEDSASKTDLIKMVQCAICSEIPIRPIFSCKGGHVVCSKCKSYVRVCKLCPEEVTDTRNRTAEALVSSFVFKCKNRAEGCNELIKWKDILQHLKHKCQFRQIKCQENLYRPCRGTLVPYSSYLSHLLNSHQIRVFRTLSSIGRSITSDKLHDCIWPVFLIGFDGQVFIQNTRLEHESMYVWVTHFGSCDEDEENTGTGVGYMARISLEKIAKSKKPSPRKTDKDPKTLKVSAQIPVLNFRKTFDDIKQGGLYLRLDRKQLVALSTNNYRNPDDNNVYKYSWNVHTKMIKM